MPIHKTKNENFFKDWSPEMAYVLGFFAADGCMIKNNRGAHFIEFHVSDKDILQKIRKLMGSNNKISIRKQRVGWKTMYRLQIGSNKMFDDLLKKGLTPQKTKTLDLPLIPAKYFNHFIRGYFDGDGNVYAKRCGSKSKKLLLAGFTCGSEIFLKKLHVKLKKLAKINGGTLHFRGGAFRLYYSINDSLKLYNFMYVDCDNLFLLRKKKVFEKFQDL